MTPEQARLIADCGVRVWHAGRRIVSECVFEEVVRDGAGGKMGRVFLVTDSHRKTVSLRQLYFTREEAEADLALRVLADKTDSSVPAGILDAPGSEGIFS